MINTIGLFGTCDGSEWRNPVIEQLEALGIDYYNPDVGDNWEPWMADEENKHLKTDHIILFPILSESLGLGSLGEIGFSVQDVARSIEKGSEQTLIVLIDDECTDERKTADERKASTKARALVKSKLKLVTHSNVYLVETVEEMLALAIRLHQVYELKDEINEEFRPAIAAVA